MKKNLDCQSIEKKITAYLHDELTESDKVSVRDHLESCSECQIQLELQRETLSLLGDALEEATAPVELNREILVTSERDVWSWPTLADLWFNPAFKATLITAVACSVFVLISVQVVSVKTVSEKDPKIHHVKLRKPQVSFSAPTETPVKKGVPSEEMTQLADSDDWMASDGFLASPPAAPTIKCDLAEIGLNAPVVTAEIPMEKGVDSVELFKMQLALEDQLASDESSKSNQVCEGDEVTSADKGILIASRFRAAPSVCAKETKRCEARRKSTPCTETQKVESVTQTNNTAKVENQPE